MKFKNLLSLGAMLSCGLVAQAQVPVFHESFEAAQTKQPTDVGYYEEINKEENDEWSIVPDGAVGNCFNFFNSIDVLNPDKSWRRAVKFRNLPLEAGKSYRLSFRFKGSNTYSNGETEVKAKMKVGLMQGVENADISILGAGDKDQYREVSYFNPHAYETYNLMYYFADKAKQDAEYDKQCADKEVYAEANKDKYFATFNVFNPGDYYLDEVELVEANIAGIIYNGDVIRVDLGYATNAKTLAGTKGYYLLPNDCVTVTVGGSEVVVESVEARSDGYLYIFLANEAGEGEVEVSFRNPAEGGLQYAEGEAITGNVLDFTTEKAELKGTFNENGDIASWLYGEAQCVATTPLDGSFGLEGISEVTFTFDKEVCSGKNDVVNHGPVAKLSDGTALKLKEGTPEFTNTLTFVSENGNFTKGSYAVTLSDVVTSKGTPNIQNEMLTFEVGKVQVSETIFTPVEGGDYKTQLETDGGIPTDWTLTLQKEGEDPQEHTGGSGARGFLYSNSNVQSAFYLRDWDGKAVATRKFNLPAGEVEIRTFTAGWNTTGSFKFSILDANGEEVKSEVVSVSTQLEKNKQGDFQKNGIRVNTAGGEYTFKVELANGSNELLFGGFELYNVTVTEGEKDESEVIAQGSFASVNNDYTPDHGTGWKIYLPDGRMRDPGANCNWGGNDWTGGGGPRVKKMGNKGMDGAAIYLARNSYATYGEYLLQTDHGGALEGNLEEKTLDLKNAKYQMTYNIIGWKNPGQAYTIQLDIYNQEEGITGTPVYTRKDAVTEACGNGNDASSDAKKIQFLWNAPKAGKYILKFTAGGDGEGECCVGNVSVETTSSLAVTYATLMNKNLEPAKEELETAKSNDKYAGSTRDALESMVAAYTNPDFHTVAEYTDAFEKLDAMVKKSAKRRGNIDKYPTCLESIIQGLNDAKGTKFEALEQYPVVEQAYNDYKDVDYVALDDDALQAAVDLMGNKGALISNMVKNCVPLITKQITDLSAAILSLDPEMNNHPVVLACGNVISDDQALVKQLKTLYAAKLYKKIAGGYEFKVWDQDMAEEIEETIDATFLIQNANFYNTTVIPAGKGNAPSTTEDFPGWNVALESGSIQSLWDTSWGQKGATETEPYYDCAVCSPWNPSNYTVEQLVNNIPVAKYTASILVATDKCNDDNIPECYAVVGGEQKIFAPNDNGEYKRDSNTPIEFENVVPTIEGNYGSISMGAKMTKACFGRVDNATLKMVGKAEGFNYAAAAQVLGEEVAAGIKNAEVAPEGNPVSVVFYDLNGRQISAPNGVAIKVEKWANGYTKISKVVEK
ncbi:MAG: hypothetical protein SO154_00495 [Prevotella sp.]|nr:hypothetical protein [Prevotella sp.]